MKNKVNLIFIISLSSAIVAIAAYIYLFVSVKNDKLMVKELIAKNREDTQKINELEQIERNLKANLAMGNKLSGYFVMNDGIVDFIQKIESIINTNGITGSVESVSENKSSTDTYQNMVDLDLSIAAKGDWNGIIKLVGLLENLPYKSTIDSVTFSNVKLEKPKTDIEKSTTLEVSKTWQVIIKMKVKTIRSSNSLQVKKEVKQPTKVIEENEEF